MPSSSTAPAEFLDIIQSCRPQLVRFVARMVGDGEAEDVVQVALAKSIAALAEFRGEASLKGWLFRIATNAAHDWNRARHGVPVVSLPESDGEAPEELVGGADQERRLVREEMSACVVEVLRRLPEHYQAALALGDCEELSDREMADALGVTVGAAKIRLHRARKRLKEELDQRCLYYRDEENTLCCDRKPEESGTRDDSKKDSSAAYRFDGGIRHQGESRNAGTTEPKESPMSKETLPTKQKHLIGIGAAIAAGCQPCTASFVSAARAAGACDRGVRLALATGQHLRSAADTAMADFAAGFPAPEVDAAFRAERATLLALVEVAAAVSANAASLVPARIAGARELGATDAQIQLAARIGATARRGAEQETDRALAKELGAATPEPGSGIAATVGCGCADPPAPAAKEGCGCGGQPSPGGRAIP